MTFHAGKRIHHSHLTLKDAKLCSTLAVAILAYKPRDEFQERGGGGEGGEAPWDYVHSQKNHLLPKLFLKQAKLEFPGVAKRG